MRGVLWAKPTRVRVRSESDRVGLPGPSATGQAPRRARDIYLSAFVGRDRVKREGECGVCTFLHPDSDAARPSSTSTISSAPTTSSALSARRRPYPWPRRQQP